MWRTSGDCPKKFCTRTVYHGHCIREACCGYAQIHKKTTCRNNRDHQTHGANAAPGRLNISKNNMLCPGASRGIARGRPRLRPRLPLPRLRLPSTLAGHPPLASSASYEPPLKRAAPAPRVLRTDTLRGPRRSGRTVQSPPELFSSPPFFFWESSSF